MSRQACICDGFEVACEAAGDECVMRDAPERERKLRELERLLGEHTKAHLLLDHYGVRRRIGQGDELSLHARIMVALAEAQAESDG